MRLDTVRDSYPVKSLAASNNKTNLYFSEVWAECKRTHPVVAGEWVHFGKATCKFTNDQATAALVYACAIRHRFSFAVKWAIYCVLEPAEVKHVSTICKSLGANGDPAGAVLCEANVLIGRAVKQADVEGDLMPRLDCDNPNVYRCDPAVLRRAIQAVVREEVEEPPSFEDPDKFWTRRWGWAVNGAHSFVRQKALESEGKVDLGAVDKSLLQSWHRRAAFECMTNNPMKYWDGRTFVSVSKKLEAGATRMLYSCDSVSYACWQHFLSGVEGVWRGKNVLLNPGSDGHDGLAERVAAREACGPVYIMLDYADFNSQHSIQAMQMVVEEVATACNYDSRHTKRLIESLAKQEIWLDGKKRGTVKSTLMSGHRGTTFFNSILNRAYMLTIDAAAVDKFGMLHVGDDIIGKTKSLHEAFAFMRKCQKAGVKMNVLKQSIGFETGEFTRMAMRGCKSVGYVARSIAGFTAGNWYTDHRLDPLEATQGMITCARSMMNRADNPKLSGLLITSACRMTRLPRDTVSALLDGSLCFDGIPAYAKNGAWHVAEYKVEQVHKGALPNNLPRWASKDYMREHLTQVEKMAIEMAGHSCQSAMLESSYSKSAVDVRGPVDLALSIVRVTRMSGDSRITLRERRHAIKEFVAAGRRGGRLLGLQGHPILHYMKKQLSDTNVATLLEVAGKSSHAAAVKRAFELDRVSVCVEGFASYSDASAICVNYDGRSPNVYVPQPVRM